MSLMASKLCPENIVKVFRIDINYFLNSINGLILELRPSIFSERQELNCWLFFILSSGSKRLMILSFDPVQSGLPTASLHESWTGENEWARTVANSYNEQLSSVLNICYNVPLYYYMNEKQVQLWFLYDFYQFCRLSVCRTWDLVAFTDHYNLFSYQILTCY